MPGQYVVKAKQRTVWQRVAERGALHVIQVRVI